MKGCKPLDKTEIEAMLKTITGKMATRNRALLILGTKSGFRVSEMLSLRLGDVIQHGRMVERVTVNRANMKGKHCGRTVLLNRDAKEALAAWIHELGDRGISSSDAYVFQSREGNNKPITKRQAWDVITKAAKAAAVTGKVATHSMRKTFANSVHLALGRDLYGTQKALGHRNIATTISYLSFDQERIDSAIASL